MDEIPNKDDQSQADCEEDTEKIEVKRSQTRKGRSPSPGVKSTAVVKYTAIESPVEYARLQCNTDLNLPPSNWGATIDSYGLKTILTRGSGMSSFRMARMFPDAVGDVDVISGAECIKRLLKLPYQPNGTISMTVHRVENTLLLDEFNVLDYLRESEWSWLKDFFHKNVVRTMTEKQRMKLGIPTSPASLQLTSKFLCHSVASLPAPEKRELQPVDSVPMIDGPFLPEPEAREGTPTEHSYNRNVLWTFEDINMLIGSDLPIFGGKDRPCVSLRLRDAKEPINVLTGIDYWLDNLMCNVPELLMCYHLDGIVQKYEPMKTEDLPNMENSKFSPKAIKNIAKNILSFLKSNATKAGHTYWLFKGPDDDVVKLYDLTSLCPDSVDNPFTTPVAMLLYRVARNMKLMNHNRHVKDLLTSVIRLLDVQKYPQIVASAHFMLADLYVPATIDPAAPGFREESDSEDETCFEDDSSGDTQLVQTSGLVLRDIGARVRDEPKSNAKPKERKGLGTHPPDRCGKALQHALEGLMALHHVTIEKSKEEERDRVKQQIISEEQHPKMANPFEPIKMQYKPLSKKDETRSRRRKKDKKNGKSGDCLLKTDNKIDKNAISIRNMHLKLQEPSKNDNFAWKLHLKTLLYEKICLAYATLAEYSYAKENFGFSLKYVQMADRVQKLLSTMIIKSRVVDLSCLLGRVGDNYFQIAKHWHGLSQFKKQFEVHHSLDLKIRKEIESDFVEEAGGAVDCNLAISFPSTELAAMVLSCDYYRLALSASGARREELLRRLASVCSELGVRYMSDAQETYVKYSEIDKPTKDEPLLKKFDELSTKSWDTLCEASDIFYEVKDLPNLALIFCNKGRYMRFKAHCEINKMSHSEKRSLYSKAEDLYKSALTLIGPRESCGCVSIWELVSWELSCHLYTKATVMQDYGHMYEHSSANEVAEALKQALKHCLLTPGPRQYLYQFRAAMIYHRLGSLYHSQYRKTTEDGPKRRTLFAATRTNYEHSSNMFAALEESGLFLTVRMETVALYETQAAVSPNLKLRSLQTAVQLLRQSQSVIKLVSTKDLDSDEKPKPDELDEKSIKSEMNLLNLFEIRLHFILKSIIQYCRAKSNKDYERMTDLYKKLYCASLKIKKDDDVHVYAKSICEVLVAMDEISKDFE